MPVGTVKFKGYREFIRAANKADKESKKIIHSKLRAAGEAVRIDAKQRFERYDKKTASGFRIRSRVGGVFIEQGLRKVTGQHPTYGTLQMRKALEPALDAKSVEVAHEMQLALEELAAIF